MTDRQNKDIWDKISSISPLIIGIVATLVGAYFTNIYNSRQLQLNQIAALDKLRPLFTTQNPQDREFAYSSFVALGYQDLAIRLIEIQGDQKGRNVLTQLKRTGPIETRVKAETALQTLDVQMLANISEGRRHIVREIVSALLGADFVIKANSQDLINAFSPISREIIEMRHFQTHSLNAGAMTGLRSVNIIDNNDQLTTYGVSVFKAMAKDIKSSNDPIQRAQ